MEFLKTTKPIKFIGSLGKKHILSVFAIALFAMAFSVIMLSTEAYAFETWDGTSTNQGLSTNPYKIMNLTDLQTLRDNVNAGTNYSGVYFKQTATDIAISGEWTPIGIDATNYFAGSYDGNGNTISGLTISTGTYKGMFGYVSGGTITNLGVTGISISDTTGGGTVGGVVAYFTGGGSITNCYSTGSISGSTGATATEYAGGIVGATVTVTAASPVAYSYSSCSFSGKFTNLGGVVGYAMSIATTRNIIGCWFDGKIGTSSSPVSVRYAGGICGYLAGGNIETSNTNYLSVDTCYSKSSIYAIANADGTSVGGVVGYSTDCGVKRAFCTGAEINLNAGSYANCNTGGVVGYFIGNNKKVRYFVTSYSTGGTVVATSGYVGGIVGYASLGASKIINCFSTNTAFGGTNGGIAGGISVPNYATYLYTSQASIYPSGTPSNCAVNTKFTYNYDGIVVKSQDELTTYPWNNLIGAWDLSTSTQTWRYAGSTSTPPLLNIKPTASTPTANAKNDDTGNVSIASSATSKVYTSDPITYYYAQGNQNMAYFVKSDGSFNGTNNGSSGSFDVTANDTYSILAVDSKKNVALTTQVVTNVAPDMTYTEKQMTGTKLSVTGIVVDASGYRYVVESSKNKIVKLDSMDNEISSYGTLGTGQGNFNCPYGIAIDITSDATYNIIYVADVKNNRIVCFKDAKNSSSFSPTYTGIESSWEFKTSGTADTFFQPAGVAVNTTGTTVYVADTYNSRVVVFAVATPTTWTTIGEKAVTGSDNAHFTYPCGIATDVSGNIWVADTINNRVQKYSASNTYSATYVVENPYGVAVDKYGNAYATERFVSNADYISWREHFGGYTNPADDAGNLKCITNKRTYSGMFIRPVGIFADPNVNSRLWIADINTGIVRKNNQ